MKSPNVRRYGPTTANFIRQALSGYPGGAAIASELIQNADDARASTIRFTFHPDRLEVRNDSVFRPKDFNSIVDIAGGHKRADVGTIGTWGTGFVSVYHLTDAPELLSARRRLNFQPLEGNAIDIEADVDQETIFRLPWRVAHSEVSRALETADIWDERAIADLRDELARRVYSYIIFLRHVRRIEVYSSEDTGSESKLVAAVTKQLCDVTQIEKVHRESWEVSYQQAGQRVMTDHWLYYRTNVTKEVTSDQITIKDREIALAFPLKNRPWLTENVPGRLYNFLPTPIATGLAFQVNGAYFPDNNRKVILLDDAAQHDKVQWNRAVLAAQASLLGDILLDARDQVGEPRRFYELLPLSSKIPDLISGFIEVFNQIAPHQPIIHNSLDQWVKPADVLLPKPNSRLHELAAPYLSVLPNGTPQSVRDYLAHAKLSAQITPQDIVKVLLPTLRPGLPLFQAHPMIDSREKLATLYVELNAAIGGMSDLQVAHLKPLALGLNGQSQLIPFISLFRIENKQRSLFKSLEIPFVDSEMLQTAPRLFEQVTPEFRGRDLVAHLAGLSFDTPPLQVIPAELGGSQDTLKKLLAFIHTDLESVNAKELARLPIVRSRQGTWYTARQQIYRHTNVKECELLKILGLAFVHDDWAEVVPYRDLYEHAGVSRLAAAHVIEALKKYLADRKKEKPLIDTPTLLGLFRYFQRQELSDADCARLRSLPICRTQGDRWVAAADNKAHLPTGHQLAPQIRPHLGKLDDNLIHDDLLNEVGRNFLHGVLRVPRLDEVAVITGLVLPKYDSKKLDDQAKSALLDYIMRTLPSLSTEKCDALLESMTEMTILRARDGKYYRPRQLYFPSERLDAVFTEGYLALHPDYGISAALLGQESVHRQHPWHPWLVRMGVAETPRFVDVVAAIQRIVESGPPTNARVNTLRPLYTELNNKDGSAYDRHGETLAPLQDLIWLPAVGDERRWHKPDAIYRPGLTDFIGNQAPVLRLAEPSIPFRNLLGMAAEPPADLVIRHLLASAEKQSEVRSFVYEFLGRSATDAQIRNLKQRSVVWDPRQRRYWPARQVFFSNQSRLFDKRRGYLERPSGNVLKFLQDIGVREEPGPQDSLDLIQEIAQEFTENQVGNALASIDLQLLNAQFSRLGRYLREAKNDIDNVQLPSDLAFVPDSDGYLHLPTRIVQVDLPNAHDFFEPGAIPQLSPALEEDARYYLSRIGVPRLSQVLRREIVEAKESRAAIPEQEKLRQRAHAFDRVAMKHLWQDQEPPPLEERPSARLREIEVKVCVNLAIRYYIAGPNQWKVIGEQHTVPVFYDDQHTHYLYLAQETRTGTGQVALALELDQVLFAGKAGCSIVEQILGWQLAELETQLDVRHYPPLPAGSISAPVLGASDDEAMGRYEETPAVEEVEGDDLTNSRHAHGELGPLFTPNTHDVPKNGAQNGHQAASHTTTQDDFARTVDHEVTPQTGLDPGVDSNGEGEVSTGDDLASLWGDDTNASFPPADGPIEADKDTNGGRNDDHAPSPHNMPRAATSQRPIAKPAPIASDTDGVPAFTGRLRPHVPYRPNDYAALRKRFGFPEEVDVPPEPSDTYIEQLMEGNGTATVISDDEFNSEFSSGGSAPPHTIRIVLSFQNRTEGFLPLTEALQAILEGAPDPITCTTIYEDWTFPLYIDRTQRVLYNQTELPRFLEAHNIPAGGIVYLKRQTYDTVRLFWKQTNSRVESLICYELTEEGELEPFVIDSADYECEVSDAVVRAEKRLEDPAALFAQARNKPGLFTVLCTIFDAAKTPLSYDELARAVHATRPVSDYAIRFELHTRPCFVQGADGRWAFQPQRGYTQDKTLAPPRPHADEEERQNRPAQAAPVANGATSRPPLPPAAVRPTSSPFTTQFQYLSAGISELSERLAISSSTIEQLEAFLQTLHALYTRLAQDLTQLQAPSTVLDDTLVALWQELQSAPAEHAQAERLVAYLAASTPEQERLLLATIDWCLVQTSPQLRANLFLPALVQAAECARRDERIALARALYRRVQDQNGGDFSTQLNELERLEDLDTYLAQVTRADSRSDKWHWAELAWQEFPGNYRLRNTLVTEIANELTALPVEINQQEDVIASTQKFVAWMQPIQHFIEILEAQDVLSDLHAQAKNLWLKLYALWEKSPKQGRYPKQMLLLAAAVAKGRDTFYSIVPADHFLDAIYVRAVMAQKKGNEVAATALAEYGRYLLEQLATKPTIQARYIQLYTLLSDLHEKQGIIHLAYVRFSVVRQLTQDPEKKRRLNDRHQDLRQRRQQVSAEAHTVFMRQLETLLAEPAFARLVDEDLFRKMVTSLEAPHVAR